MSLLLDALRRSEAQSPREPQGFSNSLSAASADPSPVSASVSAHAETNQQAAKTLMQASAASQPKQKRLRWQAWLLVVLALTLPVAGWLGWTLWSSTQATSGLIVHPLPPRAASETPSSDAPSASPASPSAPPVAVEEPVVRATEPTAEAVSTVQPDPPAPALTAASSLKTTPTPTPTPTVLGQASVAPVPSSSSVGQTPKPVVSSLGTFQEQKAEVSKGQEKEDRREKTKALAPKERLPNAATSSKLELVKSQNAEKVQQAWSFLQKGDAQAAEGLYRQVLQEKPDEADATLGLAVALHRQKKLDEAWTIYQRSIQLWPDNPTAQTGMLAILSDTDAQTAVTRLQEWIAARPRDAAAHAALAKLWAKQGKWTEALPLWQRAMSLEPHQGSYVFNLAVAYDQLHRYPEAVSHYRLALQSGSAGLPVAAIQARLVQLQEYQSP